MSNSTMLTRVIEKLDKVALAFFELESYLNKQYQAELPEGFVKDAIIFFALDGVQFVEGD